MLVPYLAARWPVCRQLISAEPVVNEGWKNWTHGSVLW